MKNINIWINLIVVTLVFSLEPLMAQTVIEEITVTARNRTENLQEVPLAISAFSSDQLDKAVIKNVNDFPLFRFVQLSVFMRHVFVIRTFT